MGDDSMSSQFWYRLAQLVNAATLRIDRPKGSGHPRYPATVYPLDYGYLQGTTSGDCAGVDVWVGSLASAEISGIICTVDAERRDTEIKVLLGCTPEEIATILDFHNRGNQGAVLLSPMEKQ